MTKFEIIWGAPEFEYREKDVSWYWVSIIAAAAIVAFSVWEKNFLFGFFIVIAELLFIIWGNKEPNILTFTITDNEIAIGDYKFYPLKEFESWSVNTLNNEWSELAFTFRSRLRTPLVIIAPEAKLEEFRANLKTVLKEAEHQESLINSIEKFLRF